MFKDKFSITALILVSQFAMANPDGADTIRCSRADEGNSAMLVGTIESSSELPTFIEIKTTQLKLYDSNGDLVLKETPPDLLVFGFKAPPADPQVFSAKYNPLASGISEVLISTRSDAGKSSYITYNGTSYYMECR